MSVVWNERNAAHLLRRTTFGGTRAEIARAVADGLERTVDRLLDFESVPNDALEQRLSQMRFDPERPADSIRHHLTRIVFTARPLEEKLTFFLHDHFATSIEKVGQPGYMLNQMALLRRFALGRFVDLTIEISKDPAMLVWLDNYTSRKEHPNENYARELLELFTLGIGNYSELDVMSAARAFTGWSLDRRSGRFMFVRQWHDDGQKDFLGRVGNWDGDDIVRIACGEFAHGKLMARKLWELFAYDNPSDAIVNDLAETYLESGTSLRTLVRAILVHPEMYSSRAIWTKIKSPVEHVAATWRLLGNTGDVTRGALGALSMQGQIPLAPPDVDGWIAGMAWINSGTLLSRVNFAGFAVSMFDPRTFIGSTQFRSASEMVDFYLAGLGPLEVKDETKQRLASYVSSDGSVPGGADWLFRQRGLAQLILALPEWQMN